MIIMKHKSRSYDQYQLKRVSDLVCDDIENLLSIFGIDEYRILDKMITMSCPIHGGDNNSAFNLYYQGDSYRGNWKCRTHQCENIFRSSIIGFIRGCLSRNKYNWQKNGDRTASFDEAVNFAISLTKHTISEFKLSKKEQEKNNFVNTIKYVAPTTNNELVEKQGVNRQSVINSLKIPSEYFLSRKFLPETLIKYDIGECDNSSKEMFSRAVVPVYDIDHKFMVGCSGRATNDMKPKWKHNEGFKAEEHLYNYWYAKDYIKSSGIVILVESPGNVWRLEEAGIHNSVAIFGASLADKQKMIQIGRAHV